MNKGYKSLNLFFSKSDFIGSYTDYEKMPVFDQPEICFLGRSNVGKSSIINSLSSKKNLAKTSQKPGLTKSINFFSINNKLIIADLPGYGFAKFSKKLQVRLFDLIYMYICYRKLLKVVFLLIDSKVGYMNSDLETINFLKKENINYNIVLTKIDKTRKNNLDFLRNEILEKKLHNPMYSNEIFLISSKKNEGIVNIQKRIYKLTK